MKTSIAQRVTYERLPNGVDLYLLKTSVQDVVVTHIAIPGGALAIQKESVSYILADLMPFGTGKKKRTAVLEKLESLGVQVYASFSDTYLDLRLVSRKVVFAEAVSLIFETVVNPLFEDREIDIARERVSTALSHQKEDTHVQASVALDRALFAKGHPHWREDTRALERELVSVSKNEIQEAYEDVRTGVGALLCIVGDVTMKDLTPSLRRAVSALQSRIQPDEYTRFDIKKLQLHTERHHVVSIHDKVNIDTLFGIPLFITHNHSDFLPLSLGVHVLGMSSTSRLFNILRTRKNLTYGSSATLVGYSARFPGYLQGTAIFPKNVFQVGRDSLQEVVRQFCERGITSKELQEHKEEVVGSYAVRLSTTAGVCQTLLQTIKSERPVSYIDEYIARIDDISHREVQNAIHTHMDYNLMKTAAAGSVSKDGSPIE